MLISQNPNKQQTKLENTPNSFIKTASRHSISDFQHPDFHTKQKFAMVNHNNYDISVFTTQQWQMWHIKAATLFNF